MLDPPPSPSLSRTAVSSSFRSLTTDMVSEYALSLSLSLSFAYSSLFVSLEVSGFELLLIGLHNVQLCIYKENQRMLYAMLFMNAMHEEFYVCRYVGGFCPSVRMYVIECFLSFFLLLMISFAFESDP